MKEKSPTYLERWGGSERLLPLHATVMVKHELLDKQALGT